MDISGSYTLNAPRERVWECLLDPDMLQRTIPGCEKLEQIGPDEWRMRVNVGIAAVKGVYEGTLRMTDRVAPEQYRMVADGTGARSVLHGEGTLMLEAPDLNTTVVNYQGEAQINGPLAGIANRVAPSVSKMLLKQFFGRFQHEMDATGASAPPATDATSASDASASDASASALTVSASGAAGDLSPSAASAAAPVPVATEPQAEAVFDASTSGVWEMSLPEARSLDDEQVVASALPLDSAPTIAGASAAPVAAMAAPEAPSSAASAPMMAAGVDGAVPIASAPADVPPDVPTPGTDGATSDVATATPTPPAEDAIFDASTSGVWEMSLPEARPLDDEQVVASALPLEATPADAPGAVSATPVASAAATPPSTPAAPADTPAPAAASATLSGASAGPTPTAMAASSKASAGASAASATTQTATRGGFMAWLMRLFGRAS